MRGGPRAHWLAVSVSLARFAAAVGFASVAFQAPAPVLSAILGLAIVSDIADGALARHLRTSSYAGRVFDLIGDKTLSVITLLYAAARGAPLAALGILAGREVFSLGARLLEVDGSSLLSTNRLFGGVLSALTWGAALLLVNESSVTPMISAVYWTAAGLAASNLTLRLYRSRGRIRATIERVE